MYNLNYLATSFVDPVYTTVVARPADKCNTSNVELVCSVENTNSKGSINWYFNKELIELDGIHAAYFLINLAEILCIEQLPGITEGIYECHFDDQVSKSYCKKPFNFCE